ncbi:MAG: efflux RND transporter periplasmic adaptor subunit, partial [Prevotellaceae bacterium]|nr:efflux RND transporter periplasmic adaptor subunit [Prevotellaceae bacterium]
ESPEVQAKMQQAMAAVDAAQAQNQKAIKGARKEQIDGAYEQWQRAEAGATVAKRTYDRVKKLYDESVLSAQKFDEAEANYKASVALAKAAESQYQMAKDGAEKEDKKAALAMVHRAQGAVQEVKAYQKETCLLSPTSGEISDIFPQEGELVGTGAPIMNVAKMDDIWVTFNVREDLLGAFSMGKKFKATVPALDKREIELQVSYVKVLGNYATWKATKVSGEFDMKTFEVHAKPTESQKDMRPGMSVLVSEKDLDVKKK